MSDKKLDPGEWFRFLLEEKEPADDPDHFAELVEAYRRVHTSSSLVTKVLGNVGVSGNFHDLRQLVDRWADGAVMPTPGLRRKIVAELRNQFSAKGG
ncbi:MAG: hypothetical protein WC866_00625 [Patescibacteria group bacterium]|jgi:hypothetical protein